MVIGGSMPLDKAVGDEIVGATINKTGTFNLKATEVGKDMVLSQSTKLVEGLYGSKAPILRLADKIARVCAPVAVGIVALTFVVWAISGPTPASTTRRPWFRQT